MYKLPHFSDTLVDSFATRMCPQHQKSIWPLFLASVEFGDELVDFVNCLVNTVFNDRFHRGRTIRGKVV